MITTVIAAISVIMFGFLPNPILPSDYTEEKEPFKNNIKGILGMFLDIRIIKLSGIFINSAFAASIG